MALRVVYITHYADNYGANRSLLALLTGLISEKAVDPLVLLACEGPFVDELRARSISFAIVPFATWMHKRVYMGGPHHRVMQHVRYWRKARERAAMNDGSISKMVELCGEHRTQVVHVNSSVIGLGPRLAGMLGVPLVWHIRELPEAHYKFHVDGGWRNYAGELRKAATVVTVSKAVAHDVRQRVGEAQRITVVENAVGDVALFDRLKARSMDRWDHIVPFRFLQLGLFHPSKGQSDALDAFRVVNERFPDTRLVLAGGGRADAVREKVKAMGLQDRVEMPGFIEDPFLELFKSHCLLQCSRHEAFSRAVLEGMASGLPVIGHASGGTSEQIAVGRSGYLFTDHAGLVEAMTDLVQDPRSARQMGEAGQEIARSRWGAEHMTRKVLDLYNGMIRDSSKD